MDPSENGPDVGLSSFAFSVPRPNENVGAADDCPLKGGSAACGSPGPAGVAVAVGSPKEKVDFGTSVVVAGLTGELKLKLNGAASWGTEVPTVVSATTGGSVGAGSDACAGLGALNVNGDGADFGDAPASGSLGAGDGTGGPNDDTAVSVLVVAPNNGTAGGAVEVEGAPNMELSPDVEDTGAEGTDGGTVGTDIDCSIMAGSSKSGFRSPTVTI